MTEGQRPRAGKQYRVFRKGIKAVKRNYAQQPKMFTY